MRADELLVVEEMHAHAHEYDVHGGLVLPVKGRRTIDAGFVLTWTETPAGGGEPYQRRGFVLGTAPEQRTVWVVPDDPQPGEGYAVVVRDVVTGDAGNANREIGGVGDYQSTAVWQAPLALPRALLRVDQVTYEGGSRSVTRLHTRADCPTPYLFSGERVERGTATTVERCYVYERWLHPVSVRPLIPSAPHGAVYVPACGECLLDGTPT